MRFRTKAQWAAAKAREYRDEARGLPRVPSSDWRGVRSRMKYQSSLYARADRYDGMAEHFRRQGL